MQACRSRSFHCCMMAQSPVLFSTHKHTSVEDHLGTIMHLVWRQAAEGLEQAVQPRHPRLIKACRTPLALCTNSSPWSSYRSVNQICHLLL